MYKAEKNILYFMPYYFPNGNPAKKKYFVVLKSDSENTRIVAALPTSKDRIPADMAVPAGHGCINDDSRNVNCFKLKAGEYVSDEFAFPLDTYIYGENVDIIDVSKLDYIYESNADDYEVVCQIDEELHKQIIDCLKNSSTVKNKIKKAL